MLHESACNMTGQRGLVQTHDGWTVVTKGPSGRRKPIASYQSRAKDDADKSRLEQRVTELEIRYHKFQKLLRASRYWDQLRGLLDAQDVRQIDSTVCLGLGSIDSESNSTVNSLWQLVLFQEIADHLQAKGHNAQLTRFAQDPKASAFDRLFLNHVGVDLLEHPSGVEKITDGTFLYDPFLPWATMLVDVLPGKRPALYIGSTMRGIIDLVEDPSSLTATMRRQQSERSDIDLDTGLSWAKEFLNGASKWSLPADFEHHEHAYRGFLMMVTNKRQPES